MVVEDVVGLEEVTDDIGDAKMELFCEISLVVALVMLIFAFFPFLGSAQEWDGATQVGGQFSRCWCNETGCGEPISGAGDGAGGENGCGDVAVTCTGLLCKL